MTKAQSIQALYGPAPCMLAQKQISPRMNADNTDLQIQKGPYWAFRSVQISVIRIVRGKVLLFVQACTCASGMPQKIGEGAGLPHHLPRLAY
jgi:hypothetical protein